jgi:NADH-quinone oxidoreductase subunit C
MADDTKPPLGAEAAEPTDAAKAADAPETPPPAAAEKADAAAADKPPAAAKAGAAPVAGAAKPLGAEAAKAAPAAKAAVAPAAAAKPAAPAGAAAPKAAASAAGAAAAPKAPHPPPAAAPPSGPTDPPPPADKPAPAFIASLQAALPDSVKHVSYWVGDWTVIVPVEHLLAAAKHLRDAPDALFDFCSDVTATDWPPRKEGRFDVVYCLFSTRLRHRIRIKVIAAENQPVPSVTGLWPAADWLEREVYDMFGVNFTGHPDRRRILMPEDWQGFPERKDYPLEGPGELLMENPLDWLKLRQARDEADIE